MCILVKGSRLNESGLPDGHKEIKSSACFDAFNPPRRRRSGRRREEEEEQIINSIPSRTIDDACIIPEIGSISQKERSRPRKLPFRARLIQIGFAESHCPPEVKTFISVTLRSSSISSRGILAIRPHFDLSRSL